MEKDFSWSDSELSGSVREYMIYFTGMGDGESRNVKLGKLLDELPYWESEVMEDLERLEEIGYIESNHSGLYPVNTEGLNDRLDETAFDSVDESFYSLDEQGLEFLRESGLTDYEESLKNIFR